MRRSIFLFFAFALTVAFIIGCSSGGGGEPTLPPIDRPAESDHIGTHLWGLYQVVIDKGTQQVDIVQLRGADQIVNVLGFLEPPPLENMSIDFDTLVFADPYIDVDVVLKHPIPDPVFMGFDVRGVVIGPELLNQDGATPVMNPDDFEGEAFGYMDGMLGAPNSYAYYDGVWGFKYFCDDLLVTDDLATFFSSETNLDNRGVFRDLSTNRRHYSLSWEFTETPIDFMVFNYAIYANYDWPIGEPPIDLDSFNITANCSEAFCCSATDTANTLYYDADADEGGGAVSLDVEIWDWQGAASQEVTIESVTTGVIAQTSPDDSGVAGSTTKSWIFSFSDVPAVPVSAGDLDILITATDPDVTFGDAWFMNLLNPSNLLYDENLWITFLASVPVGDEAPSLGFSIKDSGDLPTTLPTSDEKNFCVVADDTFNNKGVYYHAGSAGSYTLHSYPLDYSATSSLFCNMVNPWGAMASWFGGHAEMGSVEVSPMGAFIVNTRSIGPDPFWNGPRKRCCHLYGTTCNAVNVWLVFSMQTVDIMSTSDAQATVYLWWKGDPTTPAPGYTYKHDPGYEGGQDFMPGYYPNGSGDGLVGEDHTRGGMDSHPNITGWDCMVAYVEGTSAANSAVEVYKNFKTMASPYSCWTLNSTNGLVGRAKDVSWVECYGVEGFEDAVGNYMCVLEDNEDGTWQVSVWEWDDTAGTMNLVSRYDPPITGTPYNLDCDTENNEIHVWAEDSGTKYWIFHWG